MRKNYLKRVVCALCIIKKNNYEHMALYDAEIKEFSLYDKAPRGIFLSVTHYMGIPPTPFQLQ